MADIRLSKSQVKSPDKIQHELRKGFQWTAQHSKVVAMSVVAFLLLGGAISGKSYLDEKKEAEVQSRYFLIEKAMLEKKSAFAMAEAPLDPKAKKEEKAPAKATGDLAQDYGSIPEDLKKIIAEAPQSKAAKMAALNLSDLAVQYKKFDEAKATLEKVVGTQSDLISAMVLTQLGTLQADQNDCAGALTTWQKVLANSSAKTLHTAVKLKQGLCYEATNEPAKAEQIYAQIKDENKDSASAKSAEKYLRLLQAKKQ